MREESSDRLPWCVEYFLDVAYDDLRASKILYREGLYAQSLFMLSQAVEKALKSLASSRTPPRRDCVEFTREVGHKLIRNLFLPEAEEQAKRAAEVARELREKLVNEEVASKLGSYGGFLINMFEGFIRYVPEYVKAVQFFKELYADLRGAVTAALDDEELINTVLKEASELVKEAEDFPARPELTDEDLREFYVFINRLSRLFSILGGDAEKIIELFKRYMPEIESLVIKMHLASGALFAIQLLFESANVSTISRYPEDSKVGPKQIGSYAIAKSLEDFINVTESAINIMQRSYKQLKELIEHNLRNQ